MPRRKSWQIGGGEIPEKPSRSQKKRDSTALQKAGEALAALPPAERAAMSVPDDIKKALDDYAGMKDCRARRRQMQYVGRLMREAQEDGRLDALHGVLAALEQSLQP